MFFLSFFNYVVLLSDLEEGEEGPSIHWAATMLSHLLSPMYIRLLI